MEPSLRFLFVGKSDALRAISLEDLSRQLIFSGFVPAIFGEEGVKLSRQIEQGFFRTAGQLAGDGRETFSKLGMLLD